MKNKMKALLLTGILGTIVFGLTGCIRPTVDLNDYITIEVSGYNSLGEAQVIFDYEAYEEDFGDKIRARIDENDVTSMSLDLYYGGDPHKVMLSYCTDYELDKTSELSNGDVIKLVWDCEDETVKDYFNCDLKYSDIEYTVEGLQEIGTFNPFDYVTVDIAGIAPNGKVTITPDYDKPEIQYLSFSADKNSGLSNGDVVVVTADIQGGIDSFAQQFNSIPSPITMAFTVEGLTSYASSAADIDEASFNSIKQQAEDAYMAHWVQLEGNMDGLQGFTYLGNYFLYKKEGMVGNSTNQLYMVYKVDCSWDGVAYPHYVYIKFTDISVDESGNAVVDLSKYEIVGKRWNPEGNWMLYYYGYGTLDELYNDCVVTQIGAYSYENNVE